MEIILASHNVHKVAEIATVLPNHKWLNLKDIGFDQAIEEPGFTLYQNALIKAETVYQWQPGPVLADDTGLVVPALKGAPGVYSARYAGPEADDAANRAKLLQKMKGIADRAAYFLTVLAWIDDEGQRYFFRGLVRGRIAEAPHGTGGFGYDPLFIPEGHKHSFAEMPAEQKNAISHRGRALAAFRDFMAAKAPRKS